jgi:hypothetical protein
MRRLAGRPLLVAMILLSMALTALVAPAASAGGTSSADAIRGRAQPGVVRDLAIAYAATARFKRLEFAMTHGYPEDATGCLDFPDGYMAFGPGAMATHWINFDYFNDGGALDVAHPEALQYEPQADGSMRLISVEYIIPERDLPRTAEPPVLFGRQMLFHPDFGVWATHAWLWKHNPYGIFADVNPNVTCEFADRVGDAASHSHP